MVGADSIGVWVLGDQLWIGQAALAARSDARETTPVIFVESRDYVRQRRYHRQKLVLVWSAMRHFAEELHAEGWSVTYAIADDFQTPLRNWVARYTLDTLYVMEPADRPFQQLIDGLVLGCTVAVLPNNHFLCSSDDFRNWADGRKRLVMEDFYREMRKRYDVLMAGDRPEGGTWNLDKQNRKPPKRGLKPPAPLQFEPDAITQEAIATVKNFDGATYGSLDEFHWAVTRSQALQALEGFVRDRLPTFGPYQDAMVTGEETMWHALLSPYLNLGLLHPREVIATAETAYRDRSLALNCVEGFIRQVLGWREYMRGLYCTFPPDYAEENWFDHAQPLPDFLWDSSQTDMNCLQQTLQQVERTGYAHHIQRLMVLGNYSLIAGLNPQAVEQWFHAAFIDAHDWVMQTNVLGMGLFADGGKLATKPYAASANYINKMSDYCQGCRYNHTQRTGDNACPINALYWDFLLRHEDKLRSQGRMNLVLSHLNKMTADEKAAIRERARTWQTAPTAEGT
ncbi:uncharacterized protein KR51_00013050 [Rubidibacter lacunae KORDI 51-2]|uniref:Deoxyribodipyrimidine photolyase-related protein n=1 Tax=Rubidibacter lacunae KORDI 51-2 TaxID=582515 RepID=U5DMY1_9CHRO|nr:cryptochrome/photolyase family protein [Rubidibacter lacunae]ERN41974.1 uncharacterized protein KR51_00013050 [Rubidibacter lacunae KORDI 51-2]